MRPEQHAIERPHHSESSPSLQSPQPIGRNPKEVLGDIIRRSEAASDASSFPILPLAIVLREARGVLESRGITSPLDSYYFRLLLQMSDLAGQNWWEKLSVLEVDVAEQQVEAFCSCSIITTGFSQYSLIADAGSFPIRTVEDFSFTPSPAGVVSQDLFDISPVSTLPGSSWDSRLRMTHELNSVENETELGVSERVRLIALFRNGFLRLQARSLASFYGALLHSQQKAPGFHRDDAVAKLSATLLEIAEQCLTARVLTAWRDEARRNARAVAMATKQGQRRVIRALFSFAVLQHSSSALQQRTLEALELFARRRLFRRWSLLWEAMLHTRTKN